ncbi:MAG: UvrD-helicase domain-containing protein [Clostridia bacterium]|nr:UvrD-helicase domain-containing protein [Clostridia bacterium]
MAERRWTAEQLSAINERSKTLLVSAAAGSGKTATLTERIIRSLTDGEKPINIESLLVVTFTVAAAGELRVKLTAALEEAVAKNPENKSLARQLNMLPSAKIRTIDSFCNDILKMGADRVGLSLGYRIADGAECELLAISVMDALTSAIYNGERPDVASPEELDALSDCLTDSKRTEELSEILRYVYERTSSSELGVDMLLPMIEFYNTEGFEGVEKTRHGAYLMEITRELATHYRDLCARYERELSSGVEGEVMYSGMAARDKALMESLLEAVSYEKLRSVMTSYAFSTKPSKRGMEKTQTMLDYSDLREAMRDDMKKHAEYFIYSTEVWRETLDVLYRRMKTLHRVLSEFDRLFLGEKKRRAALSYSDIERLSYECLIKNGERTDIAENLARQFEAIYIDEYQDVNSLQNSIFKAISRPDNRFMVGDIKQSIYGFRHARPEIFAEMKGSFPPLGTDGGDAASIFMSKNFRCDRGIVDFVNEIFDRTFSLIGESIGYEDGDRLEYAKIHEKGEPEYDRPTVCIARQNDDGECELDGEPRVVAAKIAELLSSGTLDNGKPIQPEDIAIILRSAKDKDVRFAEALGELGIPSRISGAKSFFLSPEVLLALCLLNSIDNPTRDVYLAGLICSPLYSFTADDLYNIRHGGGGSSLYEDLVAYTEEHAEFERGRRFLDRLNYYRTIAEGMPVDALISKLYRESGLMSLGARSGGADNLTLLYDYARNFEAGAYKGLYNFIAFINNIIDKNTSFDDKREGGVQNAVKIITAHSSKGLEYPVVFLVDTARRFTELDVRPRLVFSMDLGVSFRPRTPSGLALVNSPIHDLTCHYILRKNHEEELRVLYVALTRAREKLYVVGTSPLEDPARYKNKMRLISENLSPYALRDAHSYLDVIMLTSNAPALYEEDFVEGYLRGDDKGDAAEVENEETREFEFVDNPTPCDENLTEELVRRFSFEYPDRYLTVLPEKLSVSRTSPTVLDETVGEVQLFSDEEDDGARHLPAFVTEDGVEESAKRGISTHKFLQFCDLERLALEGAEAELERLVSEGFLSELDKSRVRLGEIRKFRSSKLFSDMRGARSLYRELRFNVLLPAHIFTEREEQKAAYRDRKVLVQGVIDCIVEYPDGTLGLFDYKTDRLTREELSDPALAEAKLREKHSLQLSYYSLAVEKMFGKAPRRVEVYSLPLGDTVPVG